MSIKCTHVSIAGFRLFTRVFWGNNAHGVEKGYHNAMQPIKDFFTIGHFISYVISTQEQYEHYTDNGESSPLTWNRICEQCGAVAPVFDPNHNDYYDSANHKFSDTVPTYQIFYDRIYRPLNDPSAKPRELQPGDMFFADWYPPDLDPRGHLLIVLPNHTTRKSNLWDSMSTASNCPHNNKQPHQCWERSGEIPNLTFSPSIDAHGWHGYLRNGELITI